MFYQPFDTKPSDFFQKEHRNNFTYPQHLHICYELIVLLDGKMTVTIDNIPYSLKKNEAVLVFPNQIHSLDSTKSEHILFLFSTRLVQAYFEKNNGLIPTNNKFKIDENIFSFLNSLDENSSKFEKKRILYTVCANFDNARNYKPIYADKYNLLYKIFTFVEKNFTEDCSLSDLSKSLGYEYTYLSRYFKKFTGISYDNFVKISRLNHAGYLLHNTKLSILECSTECGFNSLRSFNRNFKDFYNMTPLQYRNSKNNK